MIISTKMLTQIKIIRYSKQSPELIKYLDEEINDLKSYRNNIKNKSDLNLVPSQ